MIIQKLKRLILTRYPGVPAAYPRAFDRLRGEAVATVVDGDRGVIAHQVVSDRLYLLLFGALGWKLRSLGVRRIDGLVVRSVNGAVGTSWRDEIHRSAFFAFFLTNRWLRAFGSVINGVAYRSATWRYPISDLLDWFRAGRHWRNLKLSTDIAAYTINDTQVGDLIIDAYLRFYPSPEFKVQDRFVRKLLWQTLRELRMATRYFRRIRPCLYLTSYAAYIEHGVPARVALKEGVTVWSFGDLNCVAKQLSLADPYHARNTSQYRSTFKALDRQDERLEAARAQLETRLSGGIDVATFYMKKSAYSGTTVSLPDGLEGAVVVFLHDFYDSPHIYPELVFDDFWQWICFTIDILQQTGTPFFLKPHPNQIALSDEALDLLKRKYPDLGWLSPNISNADLVRAGIACGVTVYGTIAHELAYLGVPSITCAQHPHYKFDFCRTAKTRDEYRNYLQTPTVQPLALDEMRRQALIFYYMHNLYGTDEELALKHAFINLWKACEATTSTEEEILLRFDRMNSLPAFADLAHAMWREAA